MITSLEQIQYDLDKVGVRSDLIKVLWWKELFIGRGDYSIMVTKDSAWYYVECLFKGKVIASAKVKVLGNTNRDTIEVIRLVQQFSGYTVS